MRAESPAFRAAAAAWRSEYENKRRIRDLRLQREYGITLADFENMLAAQGWRCAACGVSRAEMTGQRREFVVDHDHETGIVRGLTCHRCNTTLGLTGDDVSVLTALIAYLRR
jgi:hypothetical protein